VQPFRSDGERLRISTDGGVQVRWRGDGRELFYLALDGKLMAQTLTPMDDGRSLRAGVAVPLFQARSAPLRCTVTPLGTMGNALSSTHSSSSKQRRSLSS
jgi:hypothetical protein